jgi:hypothetical protein
MTRIAPSLFVASLLVLGLNATPAQALNTRSFISALGSDANPCTRSAPCRTLAFALTETSAKGEINILDPADYGTVTIDKSISIVNDVVGHGVCQSHRGGQRRGTQRGRWLCRILEWGNDGSDDRPFHRRPQCWRCACTRLRCNPFARSIDDDRQRHRPLGGHVQRRHEKLWRQLS